MKKMIRAIPLANGLTVRFYDASRRYFGDYHQVRVEISCEVPLAQDLFQSPEDFEAARKVVGDSVFYTKHEEHQGVPSLEVEAVLERVIEQFSTHTLRYFSGAGFPRRLVHSELERHRNRSKSYLLRHPHV